MLLCSHQVCCCSLIAPSHFVCALRSQRHCFFVFAEVATVALCPTLPCLASQSSSTVAPRSCVECCRLIVTITLTCSHQAHATLEQETVPLFKVSKEQQNVIHFSVVSPVRCTLLGMQTHAKTLYEKNIYFTQTSGCAAGYSPQR